jgi:Domain of unknown function (DUF4492)
MESEQRKSSSIAARVFRFYYDGFRTMSEWGKKVWIIILIKIFIIFAILKIFFFPDLLKKNFDTDAQRSDYVLEQLTNNPDTDD